MNKNLRAIMIFRKILTLWYLKVYNCVPGEGGRPLSIWFLFGAFYLPTWIPNPKTSYLDRDYQYVSTGNK